MKFIIGRGETLRERLLDLTTRPYYFDPLLRSKVVVLSVLNDDTTVAGCGVRGIYNIAHSLYVKEEYQGRGIGRKTWEKTVSVARDCGFNFITGVVPLHHDVAWHLYSKVGYKEVARLKKYSIRYIMLPFTFRGELLYILTRLVCSKLPDMLLTNIVDSIENVVHWCRRRLGR